MRKHRQNFEIYFDYLKFLRSLSNKERSRGNSRENMKPNSASPRNWIFDNSADKTEPPTLWLSTPSTPLQSSLSSPPTSSSSSPSLLPTNAAFIVCDTKTASTEETKKTTNNNTGRGTLFKFFQQQPSHHLFLPCHPPHHGNANPTPEPTPFGGNVPVAEILVIAGVLALWFAAVWTFFKQWRSLRMLEPRESRFSHLPHNLGLVKVVKKHRDSVIYKNYPENWCRTIEARQRRLERMRSKMRMTLCTDLQPGMTDSDPYSYCTLGGIPTDPVRDLAASCGVIMASVQSEDLGGAVKSNFEQRQVQSSSPDKGIPLILETHL